MQFVHDRLNRRRRNDETGTHAPVRCLNYTKKPASVVEGFSSEGAIVEHQGTKWLRNLFPVEPSPMISSSFVCFMFAWIGATSAASRTA